MAEPREEPKEQKPPDDPEKRAAERADTDPVDKDLTEEEKERLRGGR